MGEKKRREPFLVTFSEKTSDNVKPRNREAENPLINRAEPTTTKNETMSGRRRAARSLRDNHCKKRNFVVELRKLGWEKWIVSPRTYNAHYCSGSCPAILHDFYNPSNHAILQSLLHHRVDSSIPCASCVPTRLHSISVLYRNDKIIELKTMGSMVVSTCGCRWGNIQRITSYEALRIVVQGDTAEIGIFESLPLVRRHGRFDSVNFWSRMPAPYSLCSPYVAKNAFNERIWNRVEAKYWVSWPSFHVQQAWVRAMKTALESSFCAVTADSLTRRPNGRERICFHDVCITAMGGRW